MVGFSALPPDGGGVVGVLRGLAALVDVLGEPAEALTIALPLQHAAHEHLQWSRVQLLHGNVALREKQEKVTLDSRCINSSLDPRYKDISGETYSSHVVSLEFPKRSGASSGLNALFEYVNVFKIKWRVMFLSYRIDSCKNNTSASKLKY